MKNRTFSLRLALSLVLVATPLAALVVVGFTTLAIRLPQLAEQNRERALDAARTMALGVEEHLATLEKRLAIAGAGANTSARSELLEAAQRDVFSAVFLLDRDGILLDAKIAGRGDAFVNELIGLDLSKNRLFVGLSENTSRMWSDTHLSAIAGQLTVGISVRNEKTGTVIIGELPLSHIVQSTKKRRTLDQLDIWLIDSHGEVVADTGRGYAGRQNLSHIPIVAKGSTGAEISEDLDYGGRSYFAGTAYSGTLGWTFVSRIPKGLENLEIRNTVFIVVIGFVATALLGAVIAPLWAQFTSRTIRSIIEQARLIASGAEPKQWPKSLISEFSQLGKDLEAMASTLVSREQALKNMNVELEKRVEQRTQDLATSNRELSQALDTLTVAQKELVEAEKLAALGRLVAGIAHELNTPLGNSKLSLSSQSDEINKFQAIAEGKMRRSELIGFIEKMRRGTSVASVNVERACELVTNFKQVAVDRTATDRRKFRLNELAKSTIVTLQPSIPKGIKLVLKNAPDVIMMDSYPGEIGQILASLIDNAVKHAFPDGRGEINVTIRKDGDERAAILVDDDGVGMDENVVERIYDPFFTTTFGQGGTGLGLHIAYNAITTLLNGSIKVESTPGQGAHFTVTIPLVAPSDTGEATAEPDGAQ